jgi:hypothetical protein
MSKFKVGDRVAVYDIIRRTGVVVGFSEDGNRVEIVGALITYAVHVKQCRKLKPKKQETYYLEQQQLYTVPASGFNYLAVSRTPEGMKNPVALKRIKNGSAGKKKT